VRRSREAGQATIELVTLVPMLLGVALVVVQVAIVGAVLVMTESAARAGARTAGQCGDGVAVARNAQPGWLRQETTPLRRPSAPDTRTIEVRTDIPVLFSGMSLPRPVVRSATFPRTGDC
jgi:hypothetical protein